MIWKTSGRTLNRGLLLTVGLALLADACGAPPAGQPSSSVTSPASLPVAPKTLNFGSISEPPSGLIFGAGGNGAAQVKRLFHVGLTTCDHKWARQPLLATKVASIADGDWQVANDGTMAVTWKLRPNAKWHDGTPLTADDYV